MAQDSELMSVRSLWVLAIATIAVLLTMFGLMRTDMRERFQEMQVQVDSRFNQGQAQMDRRLGEVTKNQDKLTDRLDDVRERLGALEKEVRRLNQQQGMPP